MYSFSIELIESVLASIPVEMPWKKPVCRSWCIMAGASLKKSSVAEYLGCIPRTLCTVK